MAITVNSDFVIYNDFVRNGYMEKIAQNINGFNANSNNAINLTTASLVGDYHQTAFFKEISQALLVKDRDKNSTATVTPDKLTQTENVIPFLPSRFGPFESTRQAFIDIGESPEVFSTMLGSALADAVMADMLNTAFDASIAAVETNQTMVVGSGAAATDPLSYDKLIDGMALFGDRLNEIACFVMRSKDYFELMKGNITAATIDSVAGATLNAGTVATLGKPVLVTDSPTLIGKGLATDDSGVVLALQSNAINVAQSDNFFVESQTRLLKENITIEWQGESEYSVDVMGYSYDKAITVTRAALGTPANWTKTATSDKNTLGGLILTAL